MTRRLVSHTPPSDFVRAASSVSAAVAALTAFVAAKRHEYCDPLRCSDADRDALEAEVASTVADCRQRIDELAQAAPAAAGGEGERAAHYMGIVVCLAERHTEAASRFDALRAQRAKSALDMKAARRSRGSPAQLGDASSTSHGQVRECMLHMVMLCCAPSSIHCVVLTVRLLSAGAVSEAISAMGEAARRRGIAIDNIVIINAWATAAGSVSAYGSRGRKPSLG